MVLSKGKIISLDLKKKNLKSTAAFWKEIRLQKNSLLEMKTCDISFLWTNNQIHLKIFCGWGFIFQNTIFSLFIKN